MLGNESNKKSFWAKVGGIAKGALGFAGRGIKALGKGIIYPIWPQNWFKRWSEIWHDIKNGLRSVVGNPPKEYNSPIETTQASENLGIRITGYKKGIVVFEASRTLTGDIPHLNDEQLGKIETLNKESKYSNITIYGEENKVVIEIDVENIIKKLRRDIDAQGLEVSERQIKNLALQRIAEEVDGTLKGLAKITRGELERHTDLGLLNGIAEKLYQEHDNHKSSETVISKDNEKPSETMRALAGDGQKPNEAFKRIVQKTAEPFVDSCETVRSTEGKNNESRNLRKVNRSTGIGF